MKIERATSASETKLVERLKRRDETAFDELVAHYSARLVAVARRILRDEDLARDAVQEAFLNVYRGIENFNGEARLGSWLHRIAANAALGRLRQRRRRPERFLADELGCASDEDPLEVNELTHAAPAVEAADDFLARRQRCVLVRSCIARLKASHRSVLTLRYLEEYDTQQTAKILGIGTNTVKTRLLRARDALRAFLEEDRESLE
jgi:RNA polymerase sigma-70 factor (ECF subfamily)